MSDPTNNRPLQRALAWLTERPLHLTGLRLYVHAARLISGAPLQHYSQVTPHLHIGGQPFRRGLDQLKARGISATVNLRIEHDDREAGVALDNYLHLKVVDNTAPTQAQLREGVAFIARHIDAGDPVYIHCGVGIGRAPTLAAAYLISTGLTVSEALATIRAVRPFIWVNRRQYNSLLEFAQTQERR